ncbi:MAG TPA: sigma-70 family RNA polymerase sigma factor [Herpetosiphonaceae bacterium]|nr:sigma-70 family RNA polymerase sigma factor [Herpetosiphonaceae bacterium]
MSAQPIDTASLRDEELLVLIAHGDEQSLGALYDRYGRTVFGIALRVTGDRLTAEEVTQDVFQIVWQQTAGFRAASGTVAAWIIGITRHRAIDRIRSQRDKARQRDTPIDDDAAAGLTDKVDIADEASIRSDVRAALRDLPAEQRQVLELTYYGGLTTGEIASSMGTPVGTVKTRLRLGLTRLRAALLPGWAAEDQVET